MKTEFFLDEILRIDPWGYAVCYTHHEKTGVENHMCRFNYICKKGQFEIVRGIWCNNRRDFLLLLSWWTHSGWQYYPS